MIILKNTKPLKTLLNSQLKGQLKLIAEEHNIDLPKKIKKAELVEILSDFIPKQFYDDVIFFTGNELFIYAEKIRDIIRDLDSEKKPGLNLKDLNINMDNEELDKTKAALVADPWSLSFLTASGYGFRMNKGSDNFYEVPEELVHLYFKKIEALGSEFNHYQLLQIYILAMVNLYGVCTYKQLYDLFKRNNRFNFSFEKVRDYIEQLSDKRAMVEATEDDFYNIFLKPSQYDMLVEYNQYRKYYSPDKDEILFYADGLLGPEAEPIFKELAELLFFKTTVRNPFDAQEELAVGDGEWVDEVYEAILNQIKVASKIGDGVASLLEILYIPDCTFDSLNDQDRFFKLYLELVDKTRKWALKGALYSDLK